MKKSNCLSLFKTKVDLFWLVLAVVVCCSLMPLYLTILPSPNNDLSMGGSQVELDLKECEQRVTQTKLFLTQKLNDLAELKQKFDESERTGKPSHRDDSHILALEEEIRHLKAQQEQQEQEQQQQQQNAHNLDSRHSVIRRTLEVSNYLPTFDPSTLGSNPSYTVTTDIVCWSPDCSPEKLNNREAYLDCDVPLATTWNALGVKNMERFVGIGKQYPTMSLEQRNYLSEAFDAFHNATHIDSKCSRAWVNLALALMQYNRGQEALDAMTKAIELNQSARNWVILGFVQDFAGIRSAAIQSWNTALSIDPLIGERKYFGIMVILDGKPDRHIQDPIIREASREHELLTARDALTFIEFSPVSISNYATLPPGTQQFFVSSQYIILRNIIPPFVLNSIANCFIQMRKLDLLRLGDHQSKRYSSYNSRAGRILQYQMTDLLRRVIQHNAQPTYVFYGGYLPGATLPPHTDKPQCEFTFTLTLHQFPEDAKPWAISLGKRPKFARDESFIGSSNEILPPENEIVDAYLDPGDALLFMGRHLVHFRRFPLPENIVLDQIFIHHVQDDFRGVFDI